MINDRNPFDFYEAMAHGVVKAIDDNRRVGVGKFLYKVDTCFIHPILTGYNPSGKNGYVNSGIADTSKSLDTLGYFLMKKFINSPARERVCFIVPPLTGLEIIIHISSKSDEYRKRSELDIKLSSTEQNKFVHSDGIVEELDSLISSFSLSKKFPGLEDLRNMLSDKQLIGLADVFDNKEIVGARRDSRVTALHIEESLNRARHHNPRHHSSRGSEIQLTDRVDASVMAEAECYNSKRQLGFITQNFDAKFLNKHPAQAGVLRSPYCAIMALYAIEKYIKDIDNGQDAKRYVEAELDLVLEKIIPIISRLKSVERISDLPKPFREGIREFEKSNLRDIMGNESKSKDDQFSADNIDIRDKFRAASDSLDENAKEFINIYPELLNEDVLYDYSLNDHPKIIDIKRKFGL